MTIRLGFGSARWKRILYCVFVNWPKVTWFYSVEGNAARDWAELMTALFYFVSQPYEDFVIGVLEGIERGLIKL